MGESFVNDIILANQSSDSEESTLCLLILIYAASLSPFAIANFPKLNFQEIG